MPKTSPALGVVYCQSCPERAAKPTLALARKMAKANGYNTVGIEQLDSGRWSVWMYALGTPELKPARCTAPTRTAAIAGLIAVIDALPKGGKR